MESEILLETEKRVKKVAEAIRSIRVDLMTATHINNSMRNLIESILPHLNKAVGDILSKKEGVMSIAFWEIHLAIEKTVKAFLLQKGKSPPKTHDLYELSLLANKINELMIDTKIIKSFPSDKEAISLRYGEGDIKSVQDAVLAYSNALKIISTCTKALGRKIVMNNAKILFKNTPWI